MKQKASPLDMEIAHILRKMSTEDPGSETYTTAARNLETLASIKEKTGRTNFTPDVMLSAGISLLEIVLILNHEWFHPITSKAFGLIFKKH